MIRTPPLSFAHLVLWPTQLMFQDQHHDHHRFILLKLLSLQGMYQHLQGHRVVLAPLYLMHRYHHNHLNLLPQLNFHQDH
jgi:hypothetical protein